MSAPWQIRGFRDAERPGQIFAENPRRQSRIPRKLILDETQFCGQMEIVLLSPKSEVQSPKSRAGPESKVEDPPKAGPESKA